ncbi:MAG: glycosyltransferase [Bacilli bacterium]|nr:glycosyltransferase [Bacilli bacterium]
MKKKVLFCAYDLNIGGIENALINLLNNFNYDKYDVTLILEKKEGILFDKLNDKVKVLEYSVSTNKNVFLRKLSNFFKRFFWTIKNYHKYDFSCCYATYSFACNMLAYYGSSNNSFYIHSNYKDIYNESDLRIFFGSRRIKKFKSIIFVSNESKNDLISFYPNIINNSYVINNLVDYDNIVNLSREKISFTTTYKNIFVFVGRLEEKSKRLSKMIKVFAKMSDVELLIVGDGEDYDMYKEMVEKYDNIKMLGAKKNPYPYMKLADYVILTSDYEGFPVVYSEAIVLGKKIISTVDVSDDYISIPNRFGYIISKNIDEMYEQLVGIINNDNLSMEKVDFKKLNVNRIKMIEKLIES